MDKTLRAGVIGSGAIAQRGHIPGYRATEGVELVALCDVREDRVQATAAELKIPHAHTDYRQMLEKEQLDLVSVCSPNALHARMTLDALAAGAHVLCEKPMALTYADACAMVDASRQAERVLTVGFHNRYRPEMQAAQQVIASGALGAIYYAKASMLRRSGIPGYGSWFTNKDLAGGGAFMDIGCHVLDLALWMLGHPRPVRVSGAVYAKFGPRAKGLGTWGSDHYPAGARFDVDDLATAFVRFCDGLTLHVEASWAGHNTDGQRLQFLGTEGGVEYNPKLFGAEAPLHLFGEGAEGLTEAPLPIGPSEGSAYVVEITDWVRAIRTGGQPLVRPEQAALAVPITEARDRSAATGAEVVLG
ncbi:MAG: Gfo/Idh/MocA family oxidoreductase [Chloroflexota bacterium]